MRREEGKRQSLSPQSTPSLIIPLVTSPHVSNPEFELESPQNIVPIPSDLTVKKILKLTRALSLFYFSCTPSLFGYCNWSCWYHSQRVDNEIFPKILCRAFFCFARLAEWGWHGRVWKSSILQWRKHFLILSFSGSSFRSPFKDKSTSHNIATTI